MSETNSTFACLNCERSETEIPLLALRYGGDQHWICSQCVPLLIHQPQRLAGKLAGADKMTPVPPATAS